MVRCTFLPSLKLANGLILVDCMSLDNHILNISQLLQPLWSQAPKLGDDIAFPSFSVSSLAARFILVSEYRSGTCLYPGVCRGPGNRGNSGADLVPTPVLSEMAPSASGERLDTDLQGNAKWVPSGFFRLMIDFAAKILEGRQVEGLFGQGERQISEAR